MHMILYGDDIKVTPCIVPCNTVENIQLQSLFQSPPPPHLQGRMEGQVPDRLHSPSAVHPSQRGFCLSTGEKKV